MSKWTIKEHPDFLDDLDNLDKKHLEIFYKKKEKIKRHPKRQKHLRGGSNCYREPITDNMRLIYFLEEEFIWLLTIGPHDKAYNRFRSRLHSLKNRYGLG